MPRAIGMFGHGFNPDYFVNPPAFTYVLHVLYALRWGTDPASVGGAFAADPTGAFTIARAAVRVPRRAGRAADRDRRRAAVRGQARRVHRGRAARGRVPARPLLPLRAQRRADAGAARACLVGVAGIYRTRPDARVRARGRRRSGSRSRPSTRRDRGRDDRRGGVRVARSSTARAQPRVRVRRRCCSRSWSPTRTRCWTAHGSATACASRPRRPATRAAGSSASRNTSGLAYYLTTFTWGFGWLPSLAALGGASAG